MHSRGNERGLSTSAESARDLRRTDPGPGTRRATREEDSVKVQQYEHAISLNLPSRDNLSRISTQPEIFYENVLARLDVFARQITRRKVWIITGFNSRFSDQAIDADHLPGRDKQ
jgi:hypothetical protein